MLRVVLIVGLIIFAAFARGVFVPAMQSLRHPHWGWLPVAIVAETASVAAFMGMQRQTPIQGGVKIPVRSAIAITYASNAVSVTVPVAGGTASTAFTVKQFSHHGASPAFITRALGMSGIISTAAFALAVGVTGKVGGGGYTALIGAAVAIVGVVPIGVLFVILHREHSRAAIGIIPVGIGVVETAIAASLVAVGMKSEGALAAALLYRGISCWLVLGVGWIIYMNLRHSIVAESASAGRRRSRVS